MTVVAPRPAVLVVDGANVVGTRPDGWWRDRAGAAARLHAQVTSWAVGAGRDTQVVLVLEGQARAGTPAGLDAGVRTVHASASGDDEVVAQARHALAGDRTVTVVTADRGLVDRVCAAGAQVLGPRQFLSDLLARDR
ncbi:MAG: hypothetical protein ACRC35_02080 [Angustibacter sp.]